MILALSEERSRPPQTIRGASRLAVNERRKFLVLTQYVSALQAGIYAALYTFPKSKRNSIDGSLKCQEALFADRIPQLLADRIELGKTGLQISPVGIGTLQWGDPGTGFGTSYDEAALKEVFGTLIDGGISFFDTAEVGFSILERCG